MAWTSPRTWVSGEVVTAALMNTHVRDNLNAVGGAWNSYTPTLVGFTASSKVGKYVQAGKLIHVSVRCVLDAAASGTMTISLPVTAASTAAGHVGMALAGDSGTANHAGIAYLSSTTVVGFIPPGTAAIYNATNPFTWASGDSIQFTLTYEAA